MSRNGPLAGVRILDLTRLLPGPVATLHLADMGAEVIKIEDFELGDYARSAGGKKGQDSAYFRMLNRHKRAIRLDLKQAAGVEVFLRLARTADAVIESFRPGVVDKLGIGYVAVSAVNPKIAYCSLSGYGQDGPYSQRAGHDINYLGYAGVLDQIGAEGGDPAIPNLQIADLLGGALTSAMGVLAAILGAQRSGQGCRVDVSMTDSVLAHSYFNLLRLHDAGQPAARGQDVLSGGLPCYAVYRCADQRYMAVGALEGKFWKICCEVLEQPAWVARQWDAALRPEMAAVFATKARDYWVDRFAAVDCCVSPVLDPAEALQDRQIVSRRMLLEQGGLPQFAPPLRFSGHDFSLGEPAPAPGQHTTEILRQAGYDEAAISAFAASGVAA